MTVRDMVLQMAESNEATVGLLEHQIRGLLGDASANYFRTVVQTDGNGKYRLKSPTEVWNKICDLSKV